jgi:hypothetical protein
MLHGATGVGKTTVIDQTGVELKDEYDLSDFRTINFRLSQKEQGDLVGLPHDQEMVPCPFCIENGYEHKSERVLHEKKYLMQHIYKMHAKDLPKDYTYQTAMDIIRSKYAHLIQIRTAFSVPVDLPTSGYGILHLDELNRARKDVRDAAFELVWERKLGKYKLPDGWIIVCSVNPPSDKYIVHELDAAMVARYLHIRFTPEVDEWHEYAARQKLYEPIRRFIHEYPNFLGNEMTKLAYDPVYCPRTNEMAAWVLEGLDEDLVYEVMAGLLGTEAATSYMSMINSKERPVKAEKILDEYNSVKAKIKEYAKPKNNRADLLRMSIDDLFILMEKIEELNEKRIQNLKEFIKDIPKDLATGLLKRMAVTEDQNISEHFRALSNDESFREYMRKYFKHISSEELD